MFRSLGRVVRTHPLLTVLVLLFLLVIGAAAGFYCYALMELDDARADVREGRPAEALRRLDVCLFVWPRSTEVHLLAARAARLSGDFNGADRHLKQCMRLANGATEATQLEYLLMRAQTGEEDEVAPALFARVENKHPESLFFLETLAGAYMRHLRFGPAYFCLSRWIKEAPDTAKPYHWRGWVLERLNNNKEAMEDYERALELQPDLAAVRLRVVEILLEQHRPREALPHLKRLRRELPDRADILARMGECRFLQGRAKEARALLEAAVKKLPEDRPLLVHLAKLELQEGRPARAEQWARRAVKVDPADAEARFNLASSLRLQGRKQEAADALAEYKRYQKVQEQANRLLREEAKHPTSDPGAPSQIGILLLRLGQERPALHWLNQALLRDPNHRPTLRALADHYEQKGDRENAAAYRRRANEPPRKAARP
jgi:tetratricopeptide (TPR) repeat protein